MNLLPLILIAIICVSDITETTHCSLLELKEDEELIFFPTLGSYDKSMDSWRVDVSAWVFEPERNSFIRNYIIKKFAELVGEKGADNDMYVPRARAFLVDNERGKDITVRFGEKDFFVGTTGANGLAEGQLELSADTVNKLLAKSEIPGWISFRSEIADTDRTAPVGRI